jgi:hypothetical protein
MHHFLLRTAGFFFKISNSQLTYKRLPEFNHSMGIIQFPENSDPDDYTLCMLGSAGSNQS